MSRDVRNGSGPGDGGQFEALYCLSVRNAVQAGQPETNVDRSTALDLTPPERKRSVRAGTSAPLR